MNNITNKINSSTYRNRTLALQSEKKEIETQAKNCLEHMDSGNILDYKDQIRRYIQFKAPKLKQLIGYNNWNPLTRDSKKVEIIKARLAEHIKIDSDKYVTTLQFRCNHVATEIKKHDKKNQTSQQYYSALYPSYAFGASNYLEYYIKIRKANFMKLDPLHLTYIPRPSFKFL